MNTEFDQNTTAYEINLSNIDDKSITYELIKKLNVPKQYGAFVHNSIMQYGEICKCDTGYLCYHRLQWIADFMYERERILKLKKINNRYDSTR